MEISIVVPSYNEASRITSTLLQIDAYLRSSFKAYEVIVVDDGSSDTTRSVVENLQESLSSIRLVHYSPNMGKGHAIKEGVLSSSGALVLISDADLSTPIDEIEKLLPLISKECDIAIGSRGLPSSDIQVRQPWYREGMGKIFNTFVRLFVIVLFLARKKGYTIKEIPVRWLNSPNSRVRLMRDPVFMLFDLIRIRMYWLLNKYT
jgi:dolichyl-phosphate beta-glucosyltransferase